MRCLIVLVRVELSELWSLWNWNVDMKLYIFLYVFYTHYFTDLPIKQISIKYPPWTLNSTPPIKEFMV